MWMRGTRHQSRRRGTSSAVKNDDDGGSSPSPSFPPPDNEDTAEHSQTLGGTQPSPSSAQHTHADADGRCIRIFLPHTTQSRRHDREAPPVPSSKSAKKSKNRHDTRAAPQRDTRQERSRRRGRDAHSRNHPSSQELRVPPREGIAPQFPKPSQSSPSAHGSLWSSSCTSGLLQILQVQVLRAVREYGEASYQLHRTPNAPGLFRVSLKKIIVFSLRPQSQAFLRLDGQRGRQWRAGKMARMMAPKEVRQCRVTAGTSYGCENFLNNRGSHRNRRRMPSVFRKYVYIGPAFASRKRKLLRYFASAARRSGQNVLCTQSCLSFESAEFEGPARRHSGLKTIPRARKKSWSVVCL
ncbi:hypothetical protein C8R45DRAFT_990155 [Mycena sanguinolenta]|nr:hypothetical protein C8R45DRAFT_990155 [Mycena sanguinolenta]